MADFYSHYPDINITFVEDSADQLKKALFQGELDWIIMNLPTPDIICETAQWKLILELVSFNPA